jgi:hypothetical protein
MDVLCADSMLNCAVCRPALHGPMLCIIILGQREKRIEYKFMTVGTPSGTFASRLYYKYVIHLSFSDGFICIRPPQLTAQNHIPDCVGKKSAAGVRVLAGGWPDRRRSVRYLWWRFNMWAPACLETKFDLFFGLFLLRSAQMYNPIWCTSRIIDMDFSI